MVLPPTREEQEVIEDMRNWENDIFKPNSDVYPVENEDGFEVVIGDLPVLISAPHATSHDRMKHEVGKPDLTAEQKERDSLTGSLAKALQKLTGCYAIFTTKRSKRDPNFYNYFNDENGVKTLHPYKQEIKRLFDAGKIKLIIDLHGASATFKVLNTVGEKKETLEVACPNEFAVALGTGFSEGKQEDYFSRFICPMINSFVVNKVVGVAIDYPRYGGQTVGTVTTFARDSLHCSAVQLEINKDWRNLEPDKSFNTLSLVRALRDYVNSFRGNLEDAREEVPSTKISIEPMIEKVNAESSWSYLFDLVSEIISYSVDEMTPEELLGETEGFFDEDYISRFYDEEGNAIEGADWSELKEDYKVEEEGYLREYTLDELKEKIITMITWFDENDRLETIMPALKQLSLLEDAREEVPSSSDPVERFLEEQGLNPSETDCNCLQGMNCVKCWDIKLDESDGEAPYQYARVVKNKKGQLLLNLNLYIDSATPENLFYVDSVLRWAEQHPDDAQQYCNNFMDDMLEAANNTILANQDKGILGGGEDVGTDVHLDVYARIKSLDAESFEEARTNCLMIYENVIDDINMKQEELINYVQDVEHIGN